jgi:hypothetical protein
VPTTPNPSFRAIVVAAAAPTKNEIKVTINALILWRPVSKEMKS